MLNKHLHWFNEIKCGAFDGVNGKEKLSLSLSSLVLLNAHPELLEERRRESRPDGKRSAKESRAQREGKKD